MMENRAKEEPIGMKAESERGKTYKKSSRVCLCIGNSRIGVEVRLGIEMSRLGEPTINMKAHEDSSWVRLGIGSYT